MQTQVSRCSTQNKSGILATHSIASFGTQTHPLARVIRGQCMVSGLTSSSRQSSLHWTSIDLPPFHSCDGTFGQFCDPSREENDITGLLTNQGQTSLLSFMQTYWKDNKGDDNSFWSHEWNKHGTCMRCAEVTHIPLIIYLTLPYFLQ